MQSLSLLLPVSWRKERQCFVTGSLLELKSSWMAGCVYLSDSHIRPRHCRHGRGTRSSGRVEQT
eukprot:399024-Amphidinium_carterae.1